MEANLNKVLGGPSKRKKELIQRYIYEGVTADDIELLATLGKMIIKGERRECTGQAFFLPRLKLSHFFFLH